MKKINFEDLKQTVMEYLNNLDNSPEEIKKISTIFQDFLTDYKRKYNPKLKKLREKQIQIEKEIKKIEEQEIKIHWPGSAAE